MKEIEAKEFLDLARKGAVVVDARPATLFADGFYKEAVFIPYNDNFIERYEDLMESDPTTLIVADDKDVPGVLRSLKGSGVTNVAGVVKGSEISLSGNRNTDMLITIDPEEFGIDYRFDEFYLVDVRTAEAYASEHIEHAENIALAHLEQALIDLDSSQRYYIYAETAEDAITAGSLFKRNGFDLVKVLADSFENLKASGLPLIVQNKKKKPSDKFSGN